MDNRIHWPLIDVPDNLVFLKKYHFYKIVFSALLIISKRKKFFWANFYFYIVFLHIISL